jgi:hypothetical protein
VFVLCSSPNHTPINCKCPIKKSTRTALESVTVPLNFLHSRRKWPDERSISDLTYASNVQIESDTTTDLIKIKSAQQCLHLGGGMESVIIHEHPIRNS